MVKRSRIKQFACFYIVTHLCFPLGQKIVFRGLRQNFLYICRVMKDNLFYYSTNTYLSHHISKTFYNETFYVWCSPVFDPDKLDALDPRKKIPGSSSPAKIYRDLKSDVEKGDAHSAKIESNKLGLKKGVAEALIKGVIDTEDVARINEMIDVAYIADFCPLLYIIPAHLVRVRIKKISVKEMAHPLGEEYILSDLKSNEFEIIQF